jgi:hypothetical protein
MPRTNDGYSSSEDSSHSSAEDEDDDRQQLSRQGFGDEDEEEEDCFLADDAREFFWGVGGGCGWLQSTTVPSCGVLGSTLRIVGRFRHNAANLFPIHESTINWDDEGKGGIIVIQGGLKE